MNKYHKEMKINCIVRDTLTNGGIKIDIPRDSGKVVNVIVESNKQLGPTGLGAD